MKSLPCIIYRPRIQDIGMETTTMGYIGYVYKYLGFCRDDGK